MGLRIDFLAAVQQLREYGNDVSNDLLQLRMASSRELLWMGLQQLCTQAQWLPAYDEIATWMSDNKGKGLCLLGNCGLGKTVICSKFLPALFFLSEPKRILRTFVAMDMNRNTDTVLRCGCKVIDDIGTEGEKVEYGERRMVFNEVVDKAERRGEFLVVTSNLTPEEIERRYGERTLDRLYAVTRLITITGSSLRQVKNKKTEK